MASLSSTGSVSSNNSLGNTSLRGFGGMVSGIDRDSIIEQMTLGTTTKINNVKKDITNLGWKQEAYRALSDQIIDITDKYTSYSSSSSLIDPNAFAKSIISVEGSDKATKYVKASGTSDMIESIALAAVKQLASSAVRQSGTKGGDGILETGLGDLDKKIDISNLNDGVNGRMLSFGTYDSMHGWQNKVSFEFPVQYQARSEDGTLLFDEKGNKIMKNIDYTSDNYREVAQQLNWALADSGASITVNGKSTKLSECIKFEYVLEDAKDENGGVVKDDNGNSVQIGRMTLSEEGLKGLGNYKINTAASSALSALGYQGSGGAVSVKQYNENLNSFADSAVRKRTVLDSLTGSKVNINYNGTQKSIEMVTAGEKEEINQITKDSFTEEEKQKIKELQEAIENGTTSVSVDRDAIEAAVKAEILKEAGITPDKAREKVLMNLVNEATGKGYTDYQAMMKDMADSVVSQAIPGKTSVDGLTEEEIKTLGEKLGVSVDDVKTASGLSVDILAEKYELSRDKIYKEGDRPADDNNPDVIYDSDFGNQEEFKEKMEAKLEELVKREYDKRAAEEGKPKYDDVVAAAYEDAVKEAVETKAEETVVNTAILQEAKNFLEGDDLAGITLENMGDEKYKDAVAKAKEGIENKVTEEYEKQVENLEKASGYENVYKYTERVNKAVEEAEKKAKEDAIKKVEYDALQGKKLDKMKELLQKRLDREFGAGNITVGINTEGNLTFKSKSPSDSLSITTGSSGGNVLANMGIISGASNKVNLNDKLTQKSLGITEEELGTIFGENGAGLVINGVKIDGISKDSSVGDILSKINSSSAGVKATYIDTSGTFMLVSEETGEGREVTLDSPLAERLFDGGSNVKGKDAIISVSYGNGVTVDMNRSSNTFNLEGLTVTVNGTFGGKYAADNKTWEPDSSETVSFSAKADVDAATEKVKTFFEDFNKLITEVYSQLTTRSDSSYGPLTDEQKNEMSETSIENWEKKAKEGILYNDSIIRDLNSSLEGFLTELMGNGISYQDLEKIGITYDEGWGGGASTIVFNESKFRAAMETEPELVSNVFTGTNRVGGVGLAKTVENILTPYATRVASKNRGSRDDAGSYGRLIEEAGSEKVPTSTMNNFIYKQIKEMNEKIERLQSQLKTQQERYIKQFSSMESLINQYNSQSGYLSQLTG